MIEANEMIRRLHQIESELFGPMPFKEDMSDLELGEIIGNMDRTIAFGRRMVTRLINDIEDEAERDRLAEEERERRLAEYRRQQAAAKALEDGPGGEADA